MVGETLEPGAVAVNGKPLVGVAEVAVVVGEAHGQAGDDRRVEQRRVGLPLLRRVALDERLIEGAPNETDRLLFEIGGLFAAQLGSLFGDEGARFVGRVGGTEELVDGTEVDRQRIDLTTVVRVDTMLVGVERGEAVDVIPHALIRGVEQVGAVPVDLDPRVGIDGRPCVAADVVAPFDDGHAHAEFFCSLARNGQSEKA